MSQQLDASPRPARIGDGIGGWCRARIVPCSAGVASTSRSQASCASVISPWCQPGTLVSRLTIRSPATSYTRSCGSSDSLAEQLAGVRRPLVVVAHAPHHLGARSARPPARPSPAAAVGLGLAEVGEVAGEHERVRRRIDPGQPVERGGEAGDGVDRAVLPGLAGQQVGVADVGDDVGRWGELAVLDHSESVRRAGHASRSCPSPTSGSRIASPARVIALTRTLQ